MGPEHNQDESSGFQETEWLTNQLSELQNLKPEEEFEINLPQDVDYRFFISELGRPPGLPEFSGVCNPATGSIVVKKGYAVGQRGAFSEAASSFIKPRINADGRTTDDIFFHTHPWKENDPIFNDPKKSCLPSRTDINNAMAVRMIEEEDGYERVVTSIVSSGGWLGVLEAKGIRIDEPTLKGAGLSQSQIDKIKERLALAPPIWTKNYAVDETKEAELLKVAEDFYKKRQTDRSTSHSQKVKELRTRLSGCVPADLINKLVRDFSNTPDFVGEGLGEGYLSNIGLNQKQIKLVQGMTGVEISCYEVVQGEGLIKKRD